MKSTNPTTTKPIGPVYADPTIAAFFTDGGPMDFKAWRKQLAWQYREFKHKYSRKSPAYSALLTRHRLSQVMHVETMAMVHAGSSRAEIARRTEELNTEYGKLMAEAWREVEFKTGLKRKIGKVAA